MADSLRHVAIADDGDEIDDDLKPVPAQIALAACVAPASIAAYDPKAKPIVAFEDTEELADDLKEPKDWHHYLQIIVQDPRTDLFIGAITVFNLIMVIVETDRRASCLVDSSCGGEPPWSRICNVLFLIIYSVDVGLRLYVCGWRYVLLNIWNFCDVLVVVFGILGEILGSVLSYADTLKLLRLVRLLRLLRVLSMLRELYVIIHGLLNTLKAVFWASVMLFILLAILSVLAVEFLHGMSVDIANSTNLFDGCDRCHESFSSWTDALVTLFVTLVLGEDWNPLVMALYQHKGWPFLAFVIAFLTVTLGVMNLVLAVIVDAAADARENDVKHQLDLKRQDKVKASAKFHELCTSMDEDGDGHISMPELVKAFEYNEDLRQTLEVLDVDKADLECIFMLMDSDNSGDVSYAEFADLLLRMKSQDSRTILLFIKYYVLELRQRQTQEMRILEEDVLGKLDRQAKLLDYHTRLLAGNNPDALALSSELMASPKPQASPPGTLRVTVVAAYNLRNADMGMIRNMSDPYVVARMGPYKAEQTHVVEGDLNPVWDHSFSFEADRLDSEFYFKVMDKDRDADDLLGALRVNFRDLDLRSCKRFRQLLEHGSGGELEFELQFEPKEYSTTSSSGNSGPDPAGTFPPLPGAVPHVLPAGQAATLPWTDGGSSKRFEAPPSRQQTAPAGSLPGRAGTTRAAASAAFADGSVEGGNLTALFDAIARHMDGQFLELRQEIATSRAASVST